MVINLIIDHDKVHQQIFINNKDKCVQIQIQKLKFVTTVKHSSFFFLLFFIHYFFSLVYTHQNNTICHDILFHFFLLLSRFAILISYHIFIISCFFLIFRFVYVTTTCVFFLRYLDNASYL